MNPMAMGRVLVVNPPLAVPSVFVDFPPLVFHAALLFTAAMRASGIKADLHDCFLDGAVTIGSGGGFVLGAAGEALLARAAGYDSIVVCWSSFQRHAGLPGAGFKRTIRLLSGKGRRVWLADFDDGAMHYVDYRSPDAMACVRCWPPVSGTTCPWWVSPRG